MSYCPKCGNKTDETMTFCPKCGTSLTGTPPPPPPKPAEPSQPPHEGKSERGFLAYLLGGLILITVGLFSVLQISGALPDSGQNWAIMLLIVGIIIIVGGIYFGLAAKKFTRLPH